MGYIHHMSRRTFYYKVSYFCLEIGQFTCEKELN